jgi:hypothetical protein
MNYVLDTTQGLRSAHSTWHQQLETCDDAAHLLAVSRDYLATFGPEHLARLPADCRPGRIKGEDDIAYWSCKLAQSAHKDQSAPVDAELMQEILNFFLHAWVRLSAITRREIPSPPPLQLH